MKQIFLSALVMFLFNGCKNKTENKMKDSYSTELSCKLTTPELQQRRVTVLASLQKQILEKKELKNGYAFKFNNSDKMLDEITEFVKSERQCCGFFTFYISIAGDSGEIWLELTGPENAKEFIETELEF